MKITLDKLQPYQKKIQMFCEYVSTIGIENVGVDIVDELTDLLIIESKERGHTEELQKKIEDGEVH